MPLETITTSSGVEDLNVAWPLGADTTTEGDNHLRNIKQVLRNILNPQTAEFKLIAASSTIFGMVMQQPNANMRDGGSGFTKSAGGYAVMLASDGSQVVLYRFSSGTSFTNQSLNSMKGLGTSMTLESDGDLTASDIYVNV